jgi:hypothetical protein
MATKSALPLLLLGAGALFLMGSKSKPTGTTTTRKKKTPLPDLPKGEDPEEEEDPPPVVEPPVDAPIACPPGETPVEVPPGSGNWQCIVAVQPIPMKTHELQPGEHVNLPIPARYNLNPPYLTAVTMITVDKKDAQGIFRLSGDGHRVLRNNHQTGELLVEITDPGHWRIQAHDDGFDGVFIAEWDLKTKQGL